MNPAAGLKVLALPFDYEITDVLIGSYASSEAARGDRRAARNCGAYLHAAIVVSRHADGDVSLDQADHMVREGVQGLGTVGFVTGLAVRQLAPVTGMRAFPLVALTTGVGAVVGGLLGQALHAHVRRNLEKQAATTVPLGVDTLILAYPRSSSPRVEPVVTHAVNRVVNQAAGHHVQALRKALAGAEQDMAATKQAAPRTDPA